MKDLEALVDQALGFTMRTDPTATSFRALRVPTMDGLSATGATYARAYARWLVGAQPQGPARGSIPAVVADVIIGRVRRALDEAGAPVVR